MENKRNFQRELYKLIQTHHQECKKPTLLLHSCCGPCSSYVLEYLTQHFEVQLFFFNPNIQPVEEYIKRLAAQKEVLEKKNFSEVRLIEGDYNPDSFFEAVRGLENEPEGGKRCEVCIRQRMKKTAAEAKKLKTDYFATTLTVSPHKNAVYINKTGEKLESEFDISYLISDFKKKNGYKRSVELCRIHNIYRQNYCGCIFSLNN